MNVFITQLTEISSVFFSVIFSVDAYVFCSSASLAAVSAKSAAKKESSAEDGCSEVVVPFVPASVTVAEIPPARAKHMAASLFVLIMV